MSSATAALFMIDGFEETEAVCSIDILRRACVSVTTVSLGENRRLIGRSGIAVEADAMFGDIAGKSFDMLVIPGGTTAYAEHEGLLDLVRKQDEKHGKLAAICAAPAVFAKAGLLRGRRALIYPGMEDWLKDSTIGTGIVETDGNITTSRGPGTTVYFALRLVEELVGKETAEVVGEKFLVQNPAPARSVHQRGRG